MEDNNTYLMEDRKNDKKEKEKELIKEQRKC